MERLPRELQMGFTNTHQDRLPLSPEKYYSPPKIVPSARLVESLRSFVLQRLPLVPKKFTRRAARLRPNAASAETLEANYEVSPRPS